MTASPTPDPASADNPSLAVIRDRIACDGALPLQRRADMVSALNRLAVVFGRPLEGIRAGTEDLRRLMARNGPARANISQRRWSNIRSLALAALRHCGVARSFAAPMTLDWRALFDRLPDRYAQTVLSRFMHFCSARSIAPQDVSQDTLDTFLHVLTEGTLIKNPRVHHQNTCRLWNRMAAQLPDWPSVEVVVPRYGQTYAADLAHCHPELVAAIKRYLAVLAHRDPIDDRGPTRPLREASLRCIESNLKRYLGALAAAGEDIATIRTLGELVSFDRFEKAVRYLYERRKQIIANQGSSSVGASFDSVGSIAWAARCIAVKHLDCDKETAARFNAVCARLQTRRSGLSAKNDRLLAQFDDPATIRRFANAARAGWPARVPDDRRKITHTVALKAQIAITVEILTYAPMRAENLVNLNLERHLRWQGRLLYIEIPEHEVKNRERLQYVLPQTVSDRIRQYCEHYRPVLLRGANMHLFPGRNGKAKDKSCLCRQVTKAMFGATGLHITPHQFRHISAKLYLDKHPGGYEVVRRVLGHKSTSTVYAHYSGREQKSAVQCFDEAIMDVVSENGPRKPHSGLRRQLLHRHIKPNFSGRKQRRKVVA